MYLERMELLGKRLQPYQPVLERLCEVPGGSVDAAQQLPAEVGPQAAAFPPAGRGW